MLSVEPQCGIKSGGTLLTITGKHLSCGSSFDLVMANGPCKILNITKLHSHDIVYCLTPEYTSNEKLATWNREVGSSLKGQFTAIKLKMDDFSKVLDSHEFKFEYVNNPKVLEIWPDRSIVSGGLVMTILGRDFENVQTTSLVLTEIDSSNDFLREDSKLKTVNLIFCKDYFPLVCDFYYKFF